MTTKYMCFDSQCMNPAEWEIEVPGEKRGVVELYCREHFESHLNTVAAHINKVADNIAVLAGELLYWSKAIQGRRRP